MGSHKAFVNRTGFTSFSGVRHSLRLPPEEKNLKCSNTSHQNMVKRSKVTKSRREFFLARATFHLWWSGDLLHVFSHQEPHREWLSSDTLPVTKAEGGRVAEHRALGFPRKEHFHSHFIAKAHPTTTRSI